MHRVIHLAARRRGSTLSSVELPGHGRRLGKFSDLDGDATEVGRAIDAVDDDVILLGHSYGGAVITEAVCTAAGHLVYSCATTTLARGRSRAWARNR